jgi:hypothetical protein
MEAFVRLIFVPTKLTNLINTYEKNIIRHVFGHKENYLKD